MNIIKQILENKWKKDIETYVRRHGELALLILSLLLGAVGTCLYAGYVQKSKPVRVEQTAWWGGLYPDYCMPGGGGKRSADPVSISHIFEPERAGGLYRRNR